MRRWAILLALIMAVTLVLSAPMAEAKKHKKKKKHRTPTYVTVQCPNRSDGITCVGTTSNDYLVGTNSYDYIQGRAGNDLYDSKGGSDYLYDNSTTSNDYYYESVRDFGNLYIQDNGGRVDVLDLSRRYASSDFDLYRSGYDLVLDGPGSNNVRIINFFYRDSIDYFVFSDRTITVDQATSTVQQASASESATIQEQVADAPIDEQSSPASSQEATDQESTS